MEKKHKIFLENLRDSGKVNMFGAVPYLAKIFKITEDEAIKILSEWIDSFKN